MKPRWAPAGEVGLRGRRIDEDEEETYGLDDFEEDDEFDDDDLEEEELEEEDLDEEDDLDYDDFDEEFDDDGVPRRGGGRPRREWE